MNINIQKYKATMILESGNKEFIIKEPIGDPTIVPAPFKEMTQNISHVSEENQKVKSVKLLVEKPNTEFEMLMYTLIE